MLQPLPRAELLSWLHACPPASAPALLPIPLICARTGSHAHERRAGPAAPEEATRPRPSSQPKRMQQRLSSRAAAWISDTQCCTHLELLDLHQPWTFSRLQHHGFAARTGTSPAPSLQSRLSAFAAASVRLPSHACELAAAPVRQLPKRCSADLASRRCRRTSSPRAAPPLALPAPRLWHLRMRIAQALSAALPEPSPERGSEPSSAPFACRQSHTAFRETARAPGVCCPCGPVLARAMPPAG
jgi:hypothetical protein